MPFSHEQIPWKSLERFGLDAEKLQKNGDYEKLLKGERTGLIYTNTFDGTTGKFEQGKFFMINAKSGPMMMYDGVKAKTFIPNEVKGYQFSKEDKAVISTQGHLGKAVDMENKDGILSPHFVSVDKDTKTMLTWDSKAFREPKEILGVPLSKDQQELLKEGKPIFVAGMKDKAGQEFSAYLVPDAVNHKLGFLPKDRIMEQFLAPEHKSQVAKNNHGQSTEKNKDLNGPLKTGTEKEAVDKSQDNTGDKARKKGRGI